MTRVAVWGCWAKLSCTPRLWEALSAVSTERPECPGRGGYPPGRSVVPCYLPASLWPSACACVRAPCPWLHLGRQCVPCSPGEVVPAIAGRTHSLVWVCPTGERGGTDSDTPSLTRKVNPASHIVKISSRTCKVSNATPPGPGPHQTEGKVGMCRCWPSKPWAWAAWQLSIYRL